ncbi:hypothetical protein A3D84_00385 [Candidatus Woesebacteria bacterium RIFCSPHIGHO2_02_FULL_42_20]|nr:MAG: hypothetical protein A3D84_00385 [Candidatus Woesebacteria bacterium RIFCSPHIGHO2_02_FULL_42_20]OGM70673.1 MAG: hypothetical protein A3I55_02830 [Candidatus Woesebacteria bacterium RIFCSPLOWO2_02_FULL_42_10]
MWNNESEVIGGVVTKKRLFVGLVLLGLIALLFTVLSANSSCIKKVGGVVGIRNDCRQLFDCNFIIGDKDDCYFGVATYQKNVGICDMVQTLWKKNGCIINVAVQLKDRTLCEKIDRREDFWQEDRERCKEEAAENKDFSWDLKKGIEKCGPVPMGVYGENYSNVNNTWSYVAVDNVYWSPDCELVYYSAEVSRRGVSTDLYTVEIPNSEIEKRGGIWGYNPKTKEKVRVYSENEAFIKTWLSENEIEIRRPNGESMMLNL